MRPLRTELCRVFLLPGLIALGLGGTAGCSGAAPDAPTTNVMVFEGARLLVGDGQTIESATFSVVDGRFAAVGVTGEVEVPAGATRVDLSGRTVMPAIIDTHTHLRQTRAELVEDLQRRTFWGVGAAMSLGQDQGEVPFAVKAEEIAGAARFRTAGRGLTAPEPGRSDVPYWITSEEEARNAVAEQADEGVDIIKLWVDDRGGQYAKLTPALYGAAIDEAHRRGLRVTAHLFTLEDAKGLLGAGVDAFAHGVRDRDVDDAFVAMMTARPDLVLVPNLPGRGVATDMRWVGAGVSAAQLEQLQAAAVDNAAAQEAFGIQARNLARLSAAGVRIALGSDGNSPWGPHQEMEDMVAAGMTPAAVVVAATGTAAEFMRLDQAGTVAAGKSADFIVLEANPLDNITNTRRIDSVYMRGEQIDRDGMSARMTAPAE
jgi:imidazolonepropionase-like amidohydrolase